MDHNTYLTAEEWQAAPRRGGTTIQWCIVLAVLLSCSVTRSCLAASREFVRASMYQYNGFALHHTDFARWLTVLIHGSSIVAMKVLLPPPPISQGVVTIINCSDHPVILIPKSQLLNGSRSTVTLLAGAIKPHIVNISTDGSDYYTFWQQGASTLCDTEYLSNQETSIAPHKPEGQ